MGGNHPGPSAVGKARQAFVVLGMHRSGTSAMARVLGISGARLPETLMEASADNPTGFWESRRITDFNDLLLEAINSAWDDPFAGTYDRDLDALSQDHFATAQRLLEAEYGGACQIVLKDPRLSALTPLWDAVLQAEGYDPIYAIMVRNPLEVAESLRLRNGFIWQKSLLLWTSYMVSVERATRGSKRLFVGYDDLLRSPQDVLDRFEAVSHLPLPQRTDIAVRDIEGFLADEHRHHRISATDLLARTDVWAPVKDVFSWMREAAEGGDPDPNMLQGADQELLNLKQAVGLIIADREKNEEIVPMPEFGLGDVIDLGRPEVSRQVCVSGWSEGESPHGVWSTGPISKLKIALSPGVCGPLAIWLVGSPFAPEGHVQVLRIRFDGVDLGQAELAVGDKQLLQIVQGGPPSARSHVRLDIEFPTRLSPSQAGMSEDLRELGLLLERMVVTGASEPAPAGFSGEAIRFEPVALGGGSARLPSSIERREPAWGPTLELLVRQLEEQSSSSDVRPDMARLQTTLTDIQTKLDSLAEEVGDHRKAIQAIHERLEGDSLDSAIARVAPGRL